jgi:Rieske Fe-S protein
MSSRRSFLIVLGAGSALTACGSGSSSPFTSNNDPDNGDAGSGDGSSTDASSTDATPAETSGGCTPAPRDLGPVSGFAVGSWTLVGSGRSALIVGRDSAGVFVYSAVCTHAGCTLDPPDKAGNTYCSCHGATFDGQGNVTARPARTALSHYAATVCSGNVQVDTSKFVAATTRTAVP